MNLLKNQIAYFTSGNKNNIPIIFIHGFPFDHEMWRHQVSYLREKFFCVTYDIRGLGNSAPGDGQFTIDMFADDLEDLIDELDLVKPIICGLSMGGYIALRAVERFENKFSALILCDTKSAADNDEAKLKRAAGIKTINSDGAEKFVRDFVTGCFSPKTIKNKPEVFIEILNRSLTNNPTGLKGCLLAMAARTDTTSYLAKIKIPVLLICGEDDTLTPPEVMKGMSEQIPNSEFVLIPQAGHLTPVENPEKVNMALKKFLGRNIS